MKINPFFCVGIGVSWWPTILHDQSMPLAADGNPLGFDSGPSIHFRMAVSQIA
jgi:hypothetical protein